MKDMFELAAGSIQGRDHFLVRKNNQDAYGIHLGQDIIVALVADGCGDTNSPQSEVGAALGVPLVIQNLVRHTQYTLSFVSDPFGTDELPIETPDFWQTIQQDCLAQLRVTARLLGPSLTQTVTRYFLFTLVGALITPAKTVFFRIGDGGVAINGVHHRFDSGIANQPTYLAYGLLNTPLAPSQLEFQLIQVMPTSQLQSFMLNTDGGDDLIAAEGKLVPGTQHPVGPVRQFWTDDRYFENPGALQQRLNVLNRETQRVDWTTQRLQRIPGLLRDDTTLIVGRRIGGYPDAKRGLRLWPPYQS